MPSLISLAILVVGIVLMGFAPSPTPKITPPTQETFPSSTFTTIPTQTDPKQETKSSPNSGGAKPIGSVTPTTVIPQTENIELKIARCKSEKQASYDKALVTIDKTTNDREQEVFASLTQQYQDAVAQIYKSRDSNVSRIMNDTILTGSAKITLSSQYNSDADKQIENLRQTQQSFWLKQKADIETAKQQTINKINLLLSDEYNKCLL